MATKDQAISGCRVISRKSPVTFEHRGISQEKLPLSLGFFEFVHNARKRGKALLHALMELLVR
jgi:hypothetical protein